MIHRQQILNIFWSLLAQIFFLQIFNNVIFVPTYLMSNTLLFESQLFVPILLCRALFSIHKARNQPSRKVAVACEKLARWSTVRLRFNVIGCLCLVVFSDVLTSHIKINCRRIDGLQFYTSGYFSSGLELPSRPPFFDAAIWYIVGWCDITRRNASNAL